MKCIIEAKKNSYHQTLEQHELLRADQSMFERLKSPHTITVPSDGSCLVIQFHKSLMYWTAAGSVLYALGGPVAHK
jgi:hypothetical protein